MSTSLTFQAAAMTKLQIDVKAIYKGFTSTHPFIHLFYTRHQIADKHNRPHSSVVIFSVLFLDTDSIFHFQSEISTTGSMKIILLAYFPVLQLTVDLFPKFPYIQTCMSIGYSEDH